MKEKADKILIAERKSVILLGRFICIWENNIKIDIREEVYENVD